MHNTRTPANIFILITGIGALLLIALGGLEILLFEAAHMTIGGFGGLFGITRIQTESLAGLIVLAVASLYFIFFGIMAILWRNNYARAGTLMKLGVFGFIIIVVGDFAFSNISIVSILFWAIPVCLAAGAYINMSHRRNPNKRIIRWTPFVLLIPWFIGISLFRLYPIVMSFWYSLRDYQIVGGDLGFVGFDNYLMLFGAEWFWTSVRATLRYVLLGTPMVLVMAFFIAFVLNFKLKGVNLFRTIYYIPSILGGNVAVAIVWRQLFAGNGPINVLMMSVGLEPISWLRDPFFAPLSLIFLSAWQFGSVMLIFLAALQNVSPTLYEAASIDGASKSRQLFTVTLPIITPVLLFNAVNVLLRHFQEFNAAFLITNRGPFGATDFLSIRIYEFAFTRMQFGVASAMTWLFLAGIGIFTIVLFFSSKYWVHYND